MSVTQQLEEMIDLDANDCEICTDCGRLLFPIMENQGFDEPGAEHVEVIGFYKCDHEDSDLAF